MMTRKTSKECADHATENTITNEEDVVCNGKNALKTFHLFCGAGGGVLADLLLGHIPVGACEIEEYPRNVLLQRQRDGILPRFPIWDDVRTLDGKPWRGLVDVVAGGFPCQDISAAGKGSGIDGARSGLWGEMARVVREMGPRYVFVENSPMLTLRGLHRVLGDLAAMGYNAKWGVLGGLDVGLPVSRERIWIMASSNMRRIRFGGSSESTFEKGKRGSNYQGNSRKDDVAPFQGLRDRYNRRISLERWEETKPEFLRTSNDVASWMGRHRAIGNGQVPAVAATAWRILSQ
jgi:DNA (cytosine-5)-methyltransferase 1